MGTYYFLLKFHWVLSFQIFICFTDSKMIFQFGMHMVWPHLNMRIRKYIYRTDQSWFLPYRHFSVGNCALPTRG